MKHARRPKPPRQPKLNIGGPTERFIRFLENEAQRRKEELARMRANFADYIYKHSEPST